MARGLALTHAHLKKGVAGLVARRLRQARENCGLSQRELGIRAGLDPSVASPRINQYEQDKHTPNIAVLSQLADVLDKPLAYFYASEEELAELIADYQLATKQQRADARRALRSAGTKG